MDKFHKCLQFLSCSTSTVKETSQEEREEIFKVSFNSLLAELSSFKDPPIYLRNGFPSISEKIESCERDLRFLRMSFSPLDAEIRRPELLIGECMQGIQYTKHEIERMVLNLQGRIQNFKRKFEEQCEILFAYSLREYRTCNPLKRSSSITEYLAAILQNLKDLYKFKTDNEIRLLNNQIGTLKEKVTLLHNLFSLLRGDVKEMVAFNIVVHVFAQYSASIVFLYWVKAVDENMATNLNFWLIKVMQKYKPCVPAFKDVYVVFLEEMKSRHSDSLLSGQIVKSFLDLLLENLKENISMKDFKFIQESLFFVISFLVNPPDQHLEDQEMTTLTAEMDLLVKEDLYHVLSVDDMNGNSSEANTCLSDFKRKAELVKRKIQHVYEQIRDSFSYDFPKINGLGYFDFLLQSLRFLKEKLKSNIPFAKHLIIRIEEEMMSLRPCLDDLVERQKGDKELKGTWLQVIGLAYQSEYAINSCMVTSHPLWYNMARLMEVLVKLKDVNKNLKKIEGRKTHDGAILHCSIVAPSRVLEGPLRSSFDEVMVGMEEEADKIVGNLINGSKILTIVAIVGMPGIGKTTIANEVYNAPAVRHYFHRFAYCIVSQVHNAKRILLDILCDIKKDDKLFDMEEEDLADMLRKCLKGQRYLIIMDDIWDVKAWEEVKRSLPDDRNGSRVIFTSRIRNAALQAKKECIVHDLRYLSDEEGLELLRKKAFRAECCPPDFLEVGKVIAKNCKGLPLAIVLIAGLIAKTERNLNWWDKISKTIEYYGFTEDCMDVLELSYQHLPEHLKPCFLYFGAFAEDTSIPVNKLTLLWIAEGFVQNSNNENLEKTAKEYLCDLIDRSLVISDERSSYGGIKSCRIHDLLHEFCRGKAQEENFFLFMDGDKASSSSSSTIRNPYRVCINMKGKHLADATKICPNVHSLLSSRKSGYNPYDVTDVSYLKLVQVINLEELEWEILIRKMASLLHLRFLSILFVSEHLSSEFTRKLSYLWNLEILIFTGRRSFKLVLPETIWNMTRLRHVDIGDCYFSSLDVHEGKAYPKMIFLESFSSPSISSTKVLEDLLRRSPSLRKLSFDYDSLGEECGEQDFHFPKLSKLESLNVSSVGEPFLRSLVFLSTLKKLTLSNCFIQWRYLPLISEMPCLEVLKLLDYAFVGDVWDMEDTEFPKLKFLKLQKLYVGEWIAYPESFPSLEVLVVNKCCKLNAIPPCFGEMPTLKRVEVFESDGAATSFVEILEVQKDFGNEELEVVVSAPSNKETFLLHISDDDSRDERDELEEEIEVGDHFVLNP